MCLRVPYFVRSFSPSRAKIHGAEEGPEPNTPLDINLTTPWNMRITSVVLTNRNVLQDNEDD